MIDGIDYSEIGKKRLARRLAWRHANEELGLKRGEYILVNGNRLDGYVLYKRRKDTATKFKRRNGFSQKEWHARVDRLGWRCSFCGLDLTKMTVVRWSVDGSKVLERQFPVCRKCSCQRVGARDWDRCPTNVISRELKVVSPASLPDPPNSRNETHDANKDNAAVLAMPEALRSQAGNI
jgi:hypothetical protein